MAPFHPYFVPKNFAMLRLRSWKNFGRFPFVSRPTKWKWLLITHTAYVSMPHFSP